LAGSLGLTLLGAQGWSQVGSAQTAATTSVAQTEEAQQAIPDAPKPQSPLPDLRSITPGVGTTNDSPVPNNTAAPTPAARPASPTAATIPDRTQAPGVAPASNTGGNGVQTLVEHVNEVNVPFTVKDSKGKLVAGLTQRDVRVYENNVLQNIVRFTTDPHPLSVAIVVDQTLSHDNMERVNDALGALPDAFTQYDEVAVYKFNNGPQMITDFTGAQSARLAQAIDIAKGPGRDTLLAGSLSGPMSQTTVINNQNFDPNTAAQRGHSGIQLNVPKEQHTLNDAILEAAKALSTRPIERRRVIYVISDGKEYGSKAKTKDVIQYLNTNEIEVDGTLVGDSSLPFVGFIDRIHLPLTMHDNILPQYATATGGNFDAEFRIGGIERSFAQIAAEVRNRYTLDYITQEPLIDGKRRNLEVVVVGHGSNKDITVIAKQYYWPSALLARAHAVGAGAQ
jgi:VWFA-related protein